MAITYQVFVCLRHQNMVEIIWEVIWHHTTWIFIYLRCIQFMFLQLIQKRPFKLVMINTSMKLCQPHICSSFRLRKYNASNLLVTLRTRNILYDNDKSCQLRTCYINISKFGSNELTLRWTLQSGSQFHLVWCVFVASSPEFLRSPIWDFGKAPPKEWKIAIVLV